MGFFDRWKRKTAKPEQEESSFIRKTEFPDGMVVQRKADPVVWDWKTMDMVDAKENDGTKTVVPEQEESSFIRKTEFPDGMVVQRKADPVVWDWKTMDMVGAKENDGTKTGELSEQNQQSEKYKWVAKVARDLHQQNKDIDFLGAYDSTREFIALCSFVAESKGLHFDYKKVSPSDKQLIDYCRMSEEEREKLKQDYGYSTLEQQSNISR